VGRTASVALFAAVLFAPGCAGGGGFVPATAQNGQVALSVTKIHYGGSRLRVWMDIQNLTAGPLEVFYDQFSLRLGPTRMPAWAVPSVKPPQYLLAAGSTLAIGPMAFSPVRDQSWAAMALEGVGDDVICRFQLN
jgi:hypothetical protein